jgi:hypothetical protein
MNEDNNTCTPPDLDYDTYEYLKDYDAHITDMLKQLPPNDDIGKKFMKSY